MLVDAGNPRSLRHLLIRLYHLVDYGFHGLAKTVFRLQLDGLRACDLCAER